jgi:nucleoside-triphosphatase THEP1
MIYILTGPVHSGKTTFLKNIVQELKRGGYKVTGFLSLARCWGGQCFGYDLYDLRKERSTPYIRQKGEEDWERIGQFYFLPGGLDIARRNIESRKGEEILVIDEADPLELGGRGLWPSLRRVLFEPSAKSLIVVVRREILEEFISLLGRTPHRIYDIVDSTVSVKIINAISEERKGKK